MNKAIKLFLGFGLALSVASCIGKDVDDYSEFTVYPPDYYGAGGQKWRMVYDEATGMWCQWLTGPSQDGSNSDQILVNGELYNIVYDDGAWKAIKVNSQTPVGTVTAQDSTGFFVVYPGSGTFDPTTGTYSDMEPGQLPPMTGFTKTNNLHLQPSGCILNIKSNEDVIVYLEVCDDEGNFFVSSGSLDPLTGLFDANNSTPVDYSEGEGGVYLATAMLPSGQSSGMVDMLSLPMTSGRVRVCSLMIEDSEGSYYTANIGENGYSFQRGVVYTIDITSLIPD